MPYVAISSRAAAMRSAICSVVSVLRPCRRCSRASVLGGATNTKMAFSLLFRTCSDACKALRMPDPCACQQAISAKQVH